jgi:hypothetical protein
VTYLFSFLWLSYAVLCIAGTGALLHKLFPFKEA